MLIRGAALKERGLNAAGRVAAATGARIACDTFAPRCQRGAGRVQVERIPYFAEQIVEFMNGTEQLILVGAKPPVSFFAYPNKPSWCTPEDCRILYLAHAHEDGTAALEALADAVKAAKQPLHIGVSSKPDIPVGPLDPLTAGQVIAHYIPAGAIISDEGATAGGGVHRFAANIEPHDHLALTGGAIGQGFPCATGAAIACPDRRVISLQADGSGMYTVQSLWTQARERLNVTTILCSNHAYRILQIEAARAGNTEPGHNARTLTELSSPDIGWAEIAKGLGVPGVRVETAEDLLKHLENALKSDGPHLIEAML